MQCRDAAAATHHHLVCGYFVFKDSILLSDRLALRLISDVLTQPKRDHHLKVNLLCGNMIKLSRDALFNLLSSAAALASIIVPNISDEMMLRLRPLLPTEEHEMRHMDMLTHCIAIALDKTCCNSFAVRGMECKLPNASNVGVQ